MSWNSASAPDPQQNSSSPMAQCSVTGQWHPEDDLVSFQGQLVSAEGKQILLDRLMAGEAPATDMTRPGVLRRLGCLFLDGLVMIIPTIVLDAGLGFGLIAVANNTGGGFGVPAGASLFLGFYAVLLGLMYVAYFSICHAKWGCTIGKKAGKLRVVNLDGSPISTGTAWIRGFAYAGGDVVIGLMMLFAGLTGNSMVAMAVVGIVELLVFGWILADIIMALVDTRMQRSLHDRVAGTRVVYLG